MPILYKFTRKLQKGGISPITESHPIQITTDRTKPSAYPTENKYTTPTEIPFETTSNTTSPTGMSHLEALYDTTEKRGSFDKVVNLLGTIAESESYKGTVQSNENSSASGIFHFLVEDGGGYNKKKKRTKYGKYDKDGKQSKSSFQTAQQRLKNLVNEKDNMSKMSSHQGLNKEILTILNAKRPEDLNNQQQAMLTFANLKMRGDNLGKYLEGKDDGFETYLQDHVTTSGSHTRSGIKENWLNAIKRYDTQKGDKANHFSYFKIDNRSRQRPTDTPAERPASPYSRRHSPNPNLQPLIPSITDVTGQALYQAGGVLSSKSFKEALKNRHTLI